MGNIQYDIVDDFDKVFDEKGNTFLALRKLTWGDNPNVKLDIRKWYVASSGEETPGKGISFITEEGPNELTRILIESGYGNTQEIIETIKEREDFPSAWNMIVNPSLLSNSNDEDYYDPKEIFGGDKL